MEMIEAKQTKLYRSQRRISIWWCYAN